MASQSSIYQRIDLTRERMPQVTLQGAQRICRSGRTRSKGRSVKFHNKQQDVRTLSVSSSSTFLSLPKSYLDTIRRTDDDLTFQLLILRPPISGDRNKPLQDPDNGVRHLRQRKLLSDADSWPTIEGDVWTSQSAIAQNEHGTHLIKQVQQSRGFYDVHVQLFGVHFSHRSGQYVRMCGNSGDSGGKRSSRRCMKSGE